MVTLAASAVGFSGSAVKGLQDKRTRERRKRASVDATLDLSFMENLLAIKE
ncbi:MAG: hypothetical protein KKE97_14345 [Proteobacteria bacterium]|nr:hypothetical protein [Pseudomonadota bacterium]MBU4106545.1 hypothetical protein [Pseudomonadota bacterium]